MTVRQLLTSKNQIFVNYNVGSVSESKVNHRNYNTHFLEAAAEYLAAKNKRPMITIFHPGPWI
jgi:hypothetical protein